MMLCYANAAAHFFIFLDSLSQWIDEIINKDINNYINEKIIENNNESNEYDYINNYNLRNKMKI